MRLSVAAIALCYTIASCSVGEAWARLATEFVLPCGRCSTRAGSQRPLERSWQSSGGGPPRTLSLSLRSRHLFGAPRCSTNLHGRDGSRTRDENGPDLELAPEGGTPPAQTD